jgi:hypothetical protein
MPFRDNPSPDPDDRIDSGRHFSSSFVQGYRHRGIEAKEATIEDHDPSRQVSREEAARLARETGADYALRGACTEFYHCLWIVPRTDRAGTEVELVSKRGEVVFSGSVHRRAWSLARPEGMSRRVARLLVDDMRSTLSSQGIRRARTTQAWGIALTTIGGLALSSAIGLTAWLEWEGWMAIGLPAIPTLIPGIFMIVKSHQTLRRGFAVAPTVGGVAVAGQF